MPKPIDVRMRTYGVFANAGSVCLAVTLGNGDRLDLDMSHEQAEHLAMRLREAMALGPQVAAPQ